MRWPPAGGYLEYTFRRAANELHGVQLPPGPLQMRTLRNADMRETALVVEGRTVLRFAQVCLALAAVAGVLQGTSLTAPLCCQAYGFRNIQTLVQKLKRGTCEYDYVEVMACPSGCLNGGGQVSSRAVTCLEGAAGCCVWPCTRAPSGARSAWAGVPPGQLGAARSSVGVPQANTHSCTGQAQRT